MQHQAGAGQPATEFMPSGDVLPFLQRMSLLWEGLPSFSQNLLCSLAVPLTAPPHTVSPSGTYCAINTSMEEPFKEPFEERSQHD